MNTDWVPPLFQGLVLISKWNSSEMSTSSFKWGSGFHFCTCNPTRVNSYLLLPHALYCCFLLCICTWTPSQPSSLNSKGQLLGKSFRNFSIWSGLTLSLLYDIANSVIWNSTYVLYYMLVFMESRVLLSTHNLCRMWRLGKEILMFCHFVTFKHLWMSFYFKSKVKLIFTWKQLSWVLFL